MSALVEKEQLSYIAKLAGMARIVLFCRACRRRRELFMKSHSRIVWKDLLARAIDAEPSVDQAVLFSAL